MKKIVFCLMLCLTLLGLAACEGDQTNTDTTADVTIEMTDPATEEETPPSDETSPAEETTVAETEPVTEPETETETAYVPAFDPAIFEPKSVPAVNVAREGYAMASSSRYDAVYTNLHLNDGDLSTKFSTRDTWNSAEAFYVMIDLTRAYGVESLKLYPAAGDEAGFPKSFEVLTSMDGKNYTSCTVATDAVASTEGFEVALDGTEARFVKIVTKELQVAANGRGCYLALGEIEVFADTDTAHNAILNRHDAWLYVNPDIPMQLSVQYNRDGSAVGSDLKYMTTNPKVVMVDEGGLVTPVSVGTADIYVTDGVNQSMCRVEVKDQGAAEFHLETFFNPNLMPDQIGAAFDVLKSEGIEYVGNIHTLDPAGNDHAPYSIFLCSERGMAYQVAEEGVSSAPAANLTGELLIRTIQKYEHKAGFYGLCLRDEPTDDYLEYAQLVREVNCYNPHVEVYLNQFPMVSVPGDWDSYYADVASISSGNGRLYYLSFDNYPHAEDGTYNPEFDRDMNVMRQAGLQYDCATAYYLQAFWRYMLTPTEQMYNAVLGVSYGFKKFQHFIAFNGTDTMGLISPSLTVTEMGRNITAANDFIVKFEPYLGDSDAIEVYHTNETLGQELLPSDFAFTHVGGGEAIYSLFEKLDGSGKQYILVTNKNYAADGAVTLTIKATDGLRDLKLLDIESEQMVPLTVAADGTFTLSIGAAQCALVELPDGYDAARSVETDNLAYGKPAYVTSNSSDFWSSTYFSAQYLTDGNTAELGWSPVSTDPAPQIDLDLREVCAVSRIKISMTKSVWNRRCKSFTVSVSADGETYTEVANVVDYDWDKTTKSMEITFDKTDVRYVRIKASAEGNGRCFGEIEVYE